MKLGKNVLVVLMAIGAVLVTQATGSIFNTNTGSNFRALFNRRLYSRSEGRVQDGQPSGRRLGLGKKWKKWKKKGKIKKWGKTINKGYQIYQKNKKWINPLVKSYAGMDEMDDYNYEYDYGTAPRFGPNIGRGGRHNPAPRLSDGPNIGRGGRYNPAPRLSDGPNIWGNAFGYNRD